MVVLRIHPLHGGASLGEIELKRLGVGSAKNKVI